MDVHHTKSGSHGVPGGHDRAFRTSDVSVAGLAMDSSHLADVSHAPTDH